MLRGTKTEMHAVCISYLIKLLLVTKFTSTTAAMTSVQSLVLTDNTMS